MNFFEIIWSKSDDYIAWDLLLFPLHCLSELCLATTVIAKPIWNVESVLRFSRCHLVFSHEILV